MKIGIYDPYLDTLGGGEKYMLTIAECLSKNHEVFVFWENPLVLSNAEKKFKLDLKKVKITFNIFSKEISFFKRFFLSKKFDLIIILSDGSIPLLFTHSIIHFQFPVEWVRKTFQTKLKLKLTNKIICNSLFTARYIDNKFGVKSTIIYPPVDLHYKNIKKENIILHVGRFSYDSFENKNYKKQDIMINVFRKMVDNGLINWEFHLVVSVREDDLDKFETLKKLAKGYPIAFLVNAGNEELWKEYSKAKIYWHASGFDEDIKKNPEYAEHFGISTAEAMGAGAIPVVINAGGQKEIVKDGENGFLWDSIDEFSKKTLEIIHNEKLSQRISIKAKDSIMQYNKKRFCDEIAKIIEDN